MGAAAMVAPAANAQGWRNVNHLLPGGVSQCTGWSGQVTGGGNNIAEIFAGAGMVYQVIPDLPAGQYTLTANAFYRDGSAPESAARHFDGTETHDGVLFINSTEVAVKSLFDKEGVTKATILPESGYVWGLVPNSVDEAANDFELGNYVNTVTAQHPGGDMIIGYKCYGKPGTLDASKQLVGGDETEAWSIFGNFKLKDSADKEIKLGGDGKFDMIKDQNWSVVNVSNGSKGHGFQNGGVYSKTNASVYDHSMTVKDLPAGKYRFYIQSFNMHYLGAHPGYFIPMKGAYRVWEGKSAYDLYKEGATVYPRGTTNGDAVASGTVNVDKLEAYLYAYEGEKVLMANYWDGEAEVNDWFLGYEDEGTHVDGVKDMREFAFEKKIKNLFDENLTEYPETQNYKLANGSMKYVQADGNPTWFESGHMREVAAFFLAHPDLYQNYIEFELTAPKTVTIGYHKDVNQNNYSHPVNDFRLEYFDPNYTGNSTVGGSGVADVVIDENAPVEYYNLQGIRVAEPANGIYIVKQGNKTKKVVL